MPRELAYAGAQPESRSRSTLLVRVLGIYIAAGAGAIQFLDILVDRAGIELSDRFFMMAVLLGIIGIPFIGAGTALYDAARAERRVPRPPQVPATSPLPVRTAEPVALAPREDGSAALPRRLELALSYRRIAQLHAEGGDGTTASAQQDAWRREARAVVAELERLLEEDG